MRIAVVCNDTRGGVQPYVHLAAGLAKMGHNVRAVAPHGLSAMFDQAGIPVHTLEDNGDAEREATGIAERGGLATMRLMMREMPKRLRASTLEVLGACEGAELMTGGIGGMVVGLSVADKLRIPFLKTHLQPVEAPTRLYPGVMMPSVPRWLGNPGRLLSHHLSDAGLWMMFRRPMAAVRHEMGLTTQSNACEGQPALYGFSRHVVPLPETANRHVTGYWTAATPSQWTPPPQLSAWLTGGEPIVSVGFGSLAAREPDALIAMVRRAAQMAKVRIVLLAGWTRLGAEHNDDLVHCIDEAPHDWLFPKMMAIVHHGGAGTTGAAISAGVPSIVVPFAVDQPFWGRRVEALGVGPAPIPRRRLTSERLARAIATALSDKTIQARAAQVGELIQSEDGVAAAVRMFPPA